MKVAIGYGLHLTGLDTSFIRDFENMESKKLFSEFLRQTLESAIERGDISDKMTIRFAMDERHLEKGRTVPEAFYQTVDFDEEFAFEDRMLLYPLGYKEQWSRYGNLLDAFIYEAQRSDGDYDMTPEWRVKPGTLYPFTGLMKANPEKPLGVEEYWEPCFLDKEEHKDAIPKAPLHLWHLIKHLRLTRDDAHTTEAFLSLRPALMRWWS